MNEKYQIKDSFFDLIVKNPSRDGFATFLKESCGELNNIDFKETWIEKGKLAKIILAMANSGGGLIVIGVRENKKDDLFIPCGIEKLKNPADIEHDIAKLIPRNLDYEVYDFVYDNEIYGDLKDKKFQVIAVNDTPERLPFFSQNEASDIDKDVVYVRRGTSSIKANDRDFEHLIQRRIENIFKDSSEMSLKEHFEQLQFLYDQIPQTKRVLVKRGTQLSGAFAGLAMLSERMSGMLGEPDVYEDVPNENYPSENYEEFLIRMIDMKKLTIEKMLDLK